MATFFFMAHSGMHAELRAMADEATKEGRLQDAAVLRAEEQASFLDAVVMDTLGRAADAWLSPHLTEAWRTKALHSTSVLVRRLFGPAMYGTSALCSTERPFSVTVNQVLGVLSNNEAWLQWLESLPPAVRAEAKETAVSTRCVESRFSRLYSNVGSGHKPTQPARDQGNGNKVERLYRFMKNPGAGFIIQESSRKRKITESSDGG